MPAYQFSLKQLLDATAYCAVLAWCVSRLGPELDSWPMIGAFVLQTAIWLGASRLTSSRESNVLIPLCSAVVIGLIFYQLAGIPLLANAFFLACASLAEREGSPSKWKMGAICSLISLLLGTIPGLLREQQLHTLRREFSGADVRKRLDYETNL